MNKLLHAAILMLFTSCNPAHAESDTMDLSWIKPAPAFDGANKDQHKISEYRIYCSVDEKEFPVRIVSGYDTEILKFKLDKLGLTKCNMSSYSKDTGKESVRSNTVIKHTKEPYVEPIIIHPNPPTLMLQSSEEKGVYNLQIKESGLCFTVENGSKDDGGNILQSNCDNSPSQQFRIVDDDGILLITTGTGDKNKTVDSSPNDKNVYQWEDFGADNQRWLFYSGNINAGGQLQNFKTDLCIQSDGYNIESEKCVERHSAQLISFK